MISGFPNSTLKIITLVYEPYVMKTADGNWTGVCIEMMETIAQNLNISYAIYEEKTGTWGADQGNMTYNGMIGAVQRGEADIALNMFNPTANRFRVVDFSAPLAEESNILVLRRPRSASMSYFLETFSLDVWLTLILALIVMSFAVTLSVPPAKGVSLNKEDQSFAYNNLMCSVLSSMWFLGRSIFAQGTVIERKPKSMSLPILVAVWWISMVLLMGAYTSVLTSILAVRHAALPINTLEELANSNYKAMVLKDASTHEILADARSGPLKHIYDRMLVTPGSFVQNYDDIISNVLEDPYSVGIYDYESYNMLAWRRPDLAPQKCKISIAEEHFLPYLPSVVLPKNSAWGEQISIAIMRLQENGVLSQIKKKYRKREECDGSERRSNHEPLGLLEVFGVLLLLAGGITAGALVLVVEVIMSRRLRICERNVGDEVGDPPAENLLIKCVPPSATTLPGSFQHA